jgi:hypothetical protein
VHSQSVVPTDAATDLLLVVSEPLPGENAAYHDWYDLAHLPEVLARPEVLAAARFEVMRGAVLSVGQFVAVYAVRSGESDALLAGVLGAIKEGRMTRPRGMLLRSSSSSVLSSVMASGVPERR